MIMCDLIKNNLDIWFTAKYFKLQKLLTDIDSYCTCKSCNKYIGNTILKLCIFLTRKIG